MARGKKILPIINDVEIQGVAAEGKAFARVDGRVVFVSFAAPGDIVDIQLTKKKHSYAEGEVICFKSYAKERTEPFCEHFGVCGGCKWQHLPYESQLRFKQQQVYDALTRIGHVDAEEWLPILGSRQTKEYRNKLEFGFSNKKWLTREQISSGQTFDCMDAVGFHITGAFDKILDINCCSLMDNINNRLRNGIRDYALQHGLTFFDLRQQEGLLRNMMIRLAHPSLDEAEIEDKDAESAAEVMLLMQFCMKNDGDDVLVNDLLDWIHEGFPEITSLLYVDNQKCNDTIGDLPIHVYYGKEYITEQMEDLRFRVGAKSFYQTNTHQALLLYRVVREFAGLTGKENVYDLYTGTGTIANFVARQSGKVIGIEYVPEAIEDAKINSDINGIDNTSFFAGDMKDILTSQFISANGTPDVIITDPPRAGMHKDVVETILAASPRRIVYVSCNPATQARDLEMLAKDYIIKKVQPVDMFPHTHHVENVALLERR